MLFDISKRVLSRSTPRSRTTSDGLMEQSGPRLRTVWGISERYIYKKREEMRQRGRDREVEKARKRGQERERERDTDRPIERNTCISLLLFHPSISKTLLSYSVNDEGHGVAFVYTLTFTRRVVGSTPV